MTDSPRSAHIEEINDMTVEGVIAAIQILDGHWPEVTSDRDRIEVAAAVLRLVKDCDPTDPPQALIVKHDLAELRARFPDVLDGRLPLLSAWADYPV